MGYKQRSSVKLIGERPASNYTKVPRRLLLDGDLTADARLVGMYLLSLKDGREVNQGQIAEALGLPTKSKRVGNAMRNLIDHGWLEHKQYKSGNRVFKHEYVMHRERRINGVESTPYDDCASQPQNDPYGVESTPYNGVKSTPSPKYQSNTGDKSPEYVTGSVWVASGTPGSADADRNGAESKEGYPLESGNEISMHDIFMGELDSDPGEPELTTPPWAATEDAAYAEALTRDDPGMPPVAKVDPWTSEPKPELVAQPPW